MAKEYIFQGILDRKTGTPKLLEEGDYTFKVKGHLEPHENDNGNIVFPVTLLIQPSNKEVVDWPWSGETGDGEPRDGIGQFLVAINRAPPIGKMPDWDSVDGATGHCHLKIQEAQGSYPAKNKVAFYFTVKTLPQTPLPKAGPKPPVSDVEPNDIPF